MWVGFAAYLGVLTWAPKLGRRIVWGTIVLLLVAFACLPPLLSHDVYSYVDYARLGVRHGLDPYVHAPDAASGDVLMALSVTQSVSRKCPLMPHTKAARHRHLR